MEEDEEKIKNVLKALGHNIRRDIIRIIEKHNSTVSYSYLLKSLNLPASSNIAYHIKILVDANLLEKSKDGDYYLTKEGKKSLIMFSENKNSVFLKLSGIGYNFSNLNTPYILLTSWWFAFFYLGILLMIDNRILGIIFVFLAITIILMVLYRTKSILSYLLMNLIWIYFLKKNRLLIFAISLSSFLGALLVFGKITVMGNNISGLITELIGLVLLIFAFTCSIIFLILSRKKQVIDD